jgi:hypothetical protein
LLSGFQKVRSRFEVSFFSSSRDVEVLK